MSQHAQELARLFGRELDRLATEIAAYPSDEALWSTVGAQKNAPGTLGIHVAGGLSTFIGRALGGTAYVRDRDREFSERDLPREEVVRRIRECSDVVVPILADLDDERLEGTYPGGLPPQMEGASTHGFLLHLLWHLGWHTGQVYYHRLGLTR